MENLLCPHMGIPSLASIARDVCPFPDYNPNPLFTNMLSINSSRHLSDHFTAVQSSLNPKELQHFTQSLRSTFGREGRVSYGGVGVVALSLAVLFNTLAKQAKGEWVPESGPIPGLFMKNLRGYYPPHVHTMSEYLRQAPHIANNPTRMKEEAERCLKQMKTESQTQGATEKKKLFLREDLTVINLILAQVFGYELKNYYLGMGGTDSDELLNPNVDFRDDIIFNLNCDPVSAKSVFLTEVQKSSTDIQEVFKNLPTTTSVPLLLQVAQADLRNSVFRLSACVRGQTASGYSHREDFDLKANALGKWEEL